LKTFCEVYVRSILPALRTLLAKELISNYSKTQMEAAKILGITQASINYYLYGKRASKITKALENIPEVRNTVRMLAKKIAKNGNTMAYEIFCGFCIIIKSSENYLERVLRAIGVERESVYFLLKNE